MSYTLSLGWQYARIEMCCCHCRRCRYRIRRRCCHRHEYLSHSYIMLIKTSTSLIMSFSLVQTWDNNSLYFITIHLANCIATYNEQLNSTKKLYQSSMYFCLHKISDLLLFTGRKSNQNLFDEHTISECKHIAKEKIL